jgi:hypothetical protein
VAVNFALASGLLLTGAALVAAALGLAGSLLLKVRARRGSGTPVLLPRLGLLPDPPALAEGLSPVQATGLELPHSKRRQQWH